MQLIVRVIDKINPNDKALNSKLTKAGDVIVWKQDGETWGIEEIKNPDWRIIHVPNMSEEQADALIQSELPPDIKGDYPLLQRRAVRLDITQLDALSAGKLTLDQTEKVADIDTLKVSYERMIKLRAILSETPEKFYSKAEIAAMEEEFTNLGSADANLNAKLTETTVDAVLTAEDVMSTASEKPPLKDASIIGPALDVIGVV